MTLLLTIVIALAALPIVALCWVVKQHAEVISDQSYFIREQLSELSDAVDQLRLTSRARINTVATADNPEGQPRVTRVSRTAMGKRVVVGGTEGSKQRKDLEEVYPSESELKE